MMFGINLKLAAGLIAASIAAFGLSYIKGRWDGSSAAIASARIEAFNEAAKRIATMEKNNAEFRKMPKSDLCRALMRDSGLPDGSCGN